MQDYSRPMMDFVVLKFGILIAKRFFNGKSISSTLAFMPIMRKIGQKVKKFILRLFFSNIHKMIKNSGNKSLFLIFFE